MKQSEVKGAMDMWDVAHEYHESWYIFTDINFIDKCINHTKYAYYKISKYKINDTDYDIDKTIIEGISLIYV